MQRSSDRREEARRELELQVFRLELIREGKLSGDGNPTPARACDIAGRLRLVPKFNEQDPDVFFFFTLFERVAEGVVRCRQTLLLQAVLVGKAQDAHASLSTEHLSYQVVKDAVLKAYELVPEAFRTWEKRAKQSHLDFVRELTSHFTCWCLASEVMDFESLSRLGECGSYTLSCRLESA